MDWKDERLTGTTPAGESFTATMRMGGSKPAWCNVAEETSESNGNHCDGISEEEKQSSQQGEDGAAMLMHECRLQPGESKPIDTFVWGLQPAEQECMHWIPVPTTVEGAVFEATQRACWRVEEGIVACVATNLTDTDMVLHAGDRMAVLEPVTPLDAKDVLPPAEAELGQTVAAKMWQALDSTTVTMLVWITIMCSTSWQEGHQEW